MPHGFFLFAKPGGPLRNEKSFLSRRRPRPQAARLFPRLPFGRLSAVSDFKSILFLILKEKNWMQIGGFFP
nr:hypothetical protein [Bacillaceae bacterium]